MNPHKLKKWKRWLGDANIDGSIAHELINLALIRDIHSGLRQMVNDNKNLQKPSAFYSVIQATYNQSILMYIRRQVRNDGDSVSIIGLAYDLRKNCSMVTKKFYSDLYVQCKPDEEREQWKWLGEQDFEKQFGGERVNSLDPKIITEDIKKLEEIFTNSSEFIDRRLAHIDKREPTSLPSHFIIESWCEILNNVFRKYMLLLRAVDYKLEPILQHDWKIIFRTAWL